MPNTSDNAHSASSSNIQQYSLIIPDSLVSFKDVFTLILANGGIKISVERVGKILDFGI